MTYLVVKFLHVFGAIVILGTGVGIAFMVMAHRSGDPGHIARTAATVVFADYLFTMTAIIAQPITGGILMQMAGFSPADPWLLASLALYAVAGAFWLPVLGMQARIRDLATEAWANGRPLPATYHALYRRWFLFGLPGFGSVVLILWLMVVKPSV
jgi:uncharacterized membrane protein